MLIIEGFTIRSAARAGFVGRPKLVAKSFVVPAGIYPSGGRLSSDYLVQGAVAAAAYYSVISRSLVERYLSGMPRRAGHSYGKVEICIAECAADGVKIVLSAHCTCFRIKYK